MTGIGYILTLSTFGVYDAFLWSGLILMQSFWVEKFSGVLDNTQIPQTSLPKLYMAHSLTKRLRHRLNKEETKTQIAMAVMHGHGRDSISRIPTNTSIPNEPFLSYTDRSIDACAPA